MAPLVWRGRPARATLCAAVRKTRDLIMAIDWQAFWLTLQLAVTVSAVLLLLGLPIAYWIAFSRWRWKFFVEAVVALPIVLPPTVLGFFVLVSLGSQSPLGRLW